MDEPIFPIVVGVDGSRPAWAALRYAAEEAAARVAPLVVVHAICGDYDSDRTPAALVGEAPGGRRHHGYPVRRRLRDRVGGRVALGPARCRGDDWTPGFAVVGTRPGASRRLPGRRRHGLGRPWTR